MLLTYLFALVLALAPGQSDVQRRWTELRLPEYGFRIEFPAPAQAGRLENGEARWAVELDNGWTAYFCSASEITVERLQSAGSHRVLEDSVEGGLQRFPGAAVLSRSAIEIGGHPGREFVFRTDYQGTLMRLESRVFLVQRQLYVLSAVTRDGATDHAEVGRFLASFALIGR